MDLERIMLQRAQEQVSAVVALSDEERTQIRVKNLVHQGPPLGDKTCPTCGKRLAVTNRFGLCYGCRGKLSKKARKLRKGRADAIERTRAKLAAKGIVVEAA